MGADNKKSDKESSIGDVIKKVVSIGVGAAFMTEDAVRGILHDLPLPKDIVTGLVQNAKTAKDDFSNSVREELRSYLMKIDPQTLVQDVVDKYDIEVNATFKFKLKEDPKKSKET